MHEPQPGRLVTVTDLLRSIERPFVAQAAAWSAAALVGFGLVSAIIPNPVFGRQIPPEPFAVAVWLASAPLVGLVAATYTAGPPAAATIPNPLLAAAAQSVAGRPTTDPPAADATGGYRGGGDGTRRSQPQDERRRTTLGMIASVGAFLAIGCPVCNRIALVLLGTSGALTVFAPLQPFLGAASLVPGWRPNGVHASGRCPSSGLD
jgi:hypothetical protein